MNPVLGALGVIIGGLVGFLMGKKGHPHDAEFGRAGGPHEARFVTRRGTDGFCAGLVLDRMKARNFRWVRVGGGCTPAPGSRFEIRIKHVASPLIPEIPSGIDEIIAGVRAGEPPGGVYQYSLWQVLADGRERELHDPELEIGHI
jgi:hypothetical protein